jgi:hypothetical protein
MEMERSCFEASLGKGCQSWQSTLVILAKQEEEVRRIEV